MFLDEKNQAIKIRVVAESHRPVCRLIQQGFPRLNVTFEPASDPETEDNPTEKFLHILLDSTEQPIRKSWLDWLQEQEIPFLVVGEGTTRETILHIFRAGARDYIETIDGYETILLKAISKYVADCLKSRDVSRCLVFLGANGGIGASSLVANIGASLAAEQRNLLMIDTALRSGDLASLLNLNPDHSLEDLISSHLELDGEVLRQSVVRFSQRSWLLSSREDHRNPALPESSEKLHSLLNIASQEFSYTLLDAGGRSAEFLESLIPLTDLFVAPFHANLISLRRLRCLLNLLREAGAREDSIFLVENRQLSENSFSRSQIEKILRQEIHASIPDDPKTFTYSLNCGVPVCQLEQRTPAGKALQKTAEALMIKLHGPSPNTPPPAAPSGIRKLASCLGFM